MNILFDLIETQPSANAKRHGGGIYGELVFRRMVERNIDFNAIYDSKRWLNPEIKELCDKYGVKLLDINNSSFQDLVDKNETDILYSPVVNNKLKDIKNCNIVTTIHGLREIEMPNDTMQLKYKDTFKHRIKYILKYLFPKRWTEKKCKELETLIYMKNLKFVTVSNHSKYSIISYFPKVDSSNIKVFYSCDLNKYKEKLPISYQPFYLIVSANRWEKNALRAILAFDDLFSKGMLKGYSVKVCGGKASDYKIKLRNPERFDFLGYVEDKDLNDLYSKTFALVYPSINEGFGYPPLEAMMYNKLVLASPFTSITEICGNVPLYFNPYDVDEIENRILMSQNVDIYKSHKELIPAQYAMITERQESDLDLLIDYIVSA